MIQCSRPSEDGKYTCEYSGVKIALFKIRKKENKK